MLHDVPMISTWSLFHINNFQPPQCGSAKWHRPHDILWASLQMAGCVSKALRTRLGHRPSCGWLRAQPGWLNMGRKLSDIFQGQIRSPETTRNVRWKFTSVWSIWLMYDILIHISWSSKITLPSLGPRFRRLKRSRARRQAKSMSFSAISSRLRGSKMGSVTCHRRGVSHSSDFVGDKSQRDIEAKAAKVKSHFKLITCNRYDFSASFWGYYRVMCSVV